MTSELRSAVTGKQRERQEVTPKGYVPPCDYYKDGKLPPVLVVWQEARLEYFASDPAIHLHGKGNPTGKDHAASAVIEAYGDEREAKGRAEVARAIEVELSMCALANVEAPSEWIDGFEFA